MTISSNSSQSSSFINVTQQGTSKSASTRTSYNFGIRSHSDTASQVSGQKMPAQTNASQPMNVQNLTRTNTKKVSSQNKPPKKEEIKKLGEAQKKLIELMNTLLLSDIRKIYVNNTASEDNIIARKEIISNTYTQKFHPTENNQRSFSNSCIAVQKNIKNITQQLKQKSDTLNDDFTFVSDDAVNLTPQEALKSLAFKKDDFNNTRVSF